MSRKRVVIVDDIEFVRKTIQGIVTEAGFDVVAFGTNGKEAIDLYNRLLPDLILIDVVMPVISGVEAARSICKVHPEAKVIMVSGLQHESIIMECISAGARDYVVKPFLVKELLMAIDHALHSDEKIAERSSSLNQMEAS